MSLLRVMLVDDQKLILLGLERTLRRMRTSWDVAVADSGRQARELMEARPFDVLVTDLGMPGYTGIELLAWTRSQRPGTARIVLSGRADPAMLHAATRNAHRFLNKPCEPVDLLEAIAQVAGLRALPSGDEDGTLDLRGAVGGMGQLPGSPITCHRLRTYLDDPAAQPELLQEPVLQDPGLAARALQLVNSGFFGKSRPLVDPWEAVRFLGRPELVCLLGEPEAAETESRLRPIRAHHLQVARTALAITRTEHAPAPVQDLAYAGGLLSAAGPMILTLAFPGGFRDLEVEALSRQYLNLMGLPGPLLDLVGRVRTPSLAPGSGGAGSLPEASALALAAVHVASGHLDEAFLARTGFLARLATWPTSPPTSRGPR